MKYLPLIAVGLWRRPVETLLTFLAVTAGFTLFAAMEGLNVTYERAVQGARADRLIVVSRFPSTSGGLPIALEEQLKRLPGVAAVGAWASICGHYGADQKFICIVNMDEGAREAFPFPIDSSHWNELESSLDGMLISEKAAKNWNLSIGDIVPIVVGAGVRGDGSLSWPYKVIGIVPAEAAEWPRGFRVGNLKYFQNNRPVASQGAIGGFRVSVTDSGQVNDVARRIDRFFANSGTPTQSFSAREDAANSARSVVDMALLTRLVAAAGLLMIGYLTANVIARGVEERTAEFGVLQAVGFTRTQLMGLVCMEAAIPCVLGAELGAGVAALLSSVPHSWLPAEFNFPEATVSVGVFIAAACAAAVLALFSSALPILMLWRRTPAQLLAAS
jgi:putative ABC transport system permease protein